MADLVISERDVAPVRVIEHFSAPAGEQFDKGAYVSLNSAGRLVKGGANGGIAETPAKYGYEAVTVLKQGVMDLGDALAGLDFGAEVHTSDTAGSLADAAGTSTAVIGEVVGGYGSTTPDKLLRVHS